MLNTGNASENGKAGIIERALGLDIGPGLDRERTLDVIDVTLSRIEAVLAEMGEDLGSRRDGGLGGQLAFQRFMLSLRLPIARQNGRVSVSETGGFMKLTSRVNGHRIYVSKGKLRVGRVDSTLPAGLVPGSVKPTHYNGRIASWLPAEPRSVALAIDLLGREGLPPPPRGERKAHEIDIHRRVGGPRGGV